MSMDLAQFSSKPAVRAALENPFKPYSVLNFWHGFDLKDPTITNKVSESKKMASLWFSGGKEFDEICKPFSPIIRAAGKDELNDDDANDDEWDTIDGQAARLILFDQLARNCFRGTEEAYAFDNSGRELAKKLANTALSTSSSENDDEVNASYGIFIILSLMHSEDIEDHNMAFSINDWADKSSPDPLWQGMGMALQEHKDVVDRFGRYPHRNKLYGRETTDEEKAWLESDEVPGWARSQG